MFYDLLWAGGMEKEGFKTHGEAVLTCIFCDET